MRASIVLTSLAVAASSVLLGQPASAMMPVGHHGSASKAKLACETFIPGFDSAGHATYTEVKNNKVTSDSTSKNKLGFDATAIGYYDGTSNSLQVSVVAANGTPRRVTMTFTKKGKVELSKGSTKYKQNNFKPRLFADNAGFYAYTISDGGALERWSLTRYRNGSLKYAQKVKLGKGYGDFTSLQATNYFTIKGATKEVLMGTTSTGALVQIDVPAKNPTKLKQRTLATTGYAGTTELSWSICNDDFSHLVLVTIDPVANTAQWTTVKNVDSKPKATLQGEVTGGDWDRVGVL